MEVLIRFGIFLGIFAIMTGWEVWRPRRPLSQSKAWRWLTNLALTVLDTLVVRLTVGAVSLISARSP